MKEVIGNEFLKVEINSKGAELTSIYNKVKHQEYLWQGDPEWWPRQAPVLFPIVGKLNNGSYQFKGKIYHLPQHGFARDLEFTLLSKEQGRISFVLSSNNSTNLNYPFSFTLIITYKLEGVALHTIYEVKNNGSETMYFSLGAHPGFVCPLNNSEEFSDYFLEFEKEETIDRHLLDNGCFNGRTERVLTNEKVLNLDYSLFEKDAIVFKALKSNFMTLKSRKSDYSLKFAFNDFPYFGIWTKPGAPFVCLEPWCGMADNKGFNEDFSQKEGIEALGRGSVFQRSFSVTI